MNTRGFAVGVIIGALFVTSDVIAIKIEAEADCAASPLLAVTSTSYVPSRSMVVQSSEAFGP